MTRLRAHSSVALLVVLPLTLNTSSGALVTSSTAPGASPAADARVGTASPVSTQVSRSNHRFFSLEGKVLEAHRDGARGLAGGKVASARGTRVWTASDLADHGLPVAAERAYRRAATAMAAADPACQLPWTLLAAIGRVESDHGRYGGSRLGSNGVSRPLIIGVALNGVGPVAAIRDTDDGKLDKDRVWDRAVGPMQFIPSTWRGMARDGDGDGVASPNDLDDAALAAAAYLCAGSGSVLGESAMGAAIYRYNQSDYYVDLVLAFEAGYRTGVFVMPPPPVEDEPADKPKKRRPRAGSDPAPKQQPRGGGDATSTPSPTPTSTPAPKKTTGTKSTGGTKTSPPKTDDSTPKQPKPTPTPTPTEDPGPNLVGLSGTFNKDCGSPWCVGSKTLDLGPSTQLAKPAADDFDGDGDDTETNADEFAGLVGKSVNLLVESVGGKAVVYPIDGMDYRGADGSFIS